MFNSITTIPEAKKEFSPNLPLYELIFNISGENNTHFDGVYIHDCENSIRYLPKGNHKGSYTVEKICDGMCIDIYFDTNDLMVDEACGFENMPQLKNLFLKIYNIWQGKKEGYYAECMQLLYEIIKIIKKTNSSYISRKQKACLTPAMDYIAENYKNFEFDYNELCSKTGLCYSYFKKLFVSNFGMSPVKYITNLKIEFAKELLITEKYSVGEIANMCGFENIYYFSTVFKKHTGVSPKNYKLNK